MATIASLSPASSFCDATARPLRDTEQRPDVVGARWSGLETAPPSRTERNGGDVLLVVVVVVVVRARPQPPVRAVLIHPSSHLAIRAPIHPPSRRE